MPGMKGRERLPKGDSVGADLGVGFCLSDSGVLKVSKRIGDSAMASRKKLRAAESCIWVLW